LIGGSDDMNYLIGIWNWFAVTVYILLIFLAFRLVYIYSKEESGYWCVEMPESSKPPLFPCDLSMAFKMGLTVFSISAFLVFLFEWWMGKPEVGALATIFVLTIIFFPKEIVDLYWGSICYFSNLFGKLSEALTAVKCPECRIVAQPTGKYRLPERFIGKRKIKGEQELRCPSCGAVLYR
jgi:hypothetical protein